MTVTIDGVEMASPQEILNKLVGDLTFDPLAFPRMKDGPQGEVLRKIVGLDFGESDAKRAKLYAERTDANRLANTSEALVGSAPPKPDANEAPIDVAGLAREQQEALDHNQKVDDAERKASEWERVYTQREQHADETLKRLERDVQEAKDKLFAEGTATQNAADDAKQMVTASRKAADELNRVDAGDLAEKIQHANAHNAAITDYHGYLERRQAASKARTAADSLTDDIEKIDAEKARKLASAEYPMEGLTINDSGTVELDGLPFRQASGAQQLRASVAIGLKQGAPIRVMLCEDGSLLDDDGLATLHAIAEENDAQVFLERVASRASGPSAVFIEDGEVVETMETSNGS